MTAYFPVVVDTNIVLDLLVFKDSASAPLQQALQSGQVRWLATEPMRSELARVLGYPNVESRLAQCQSTAQQVLSQFDAMSQKTAVALQSEVRCPDPDDQIFIDLAVAHRSLLLSKDQAVLSLGKQLSVLGVRAQSTLLPQLIAMP